MNKTITILHLEDHPLEVEKVRLAVREGFDQINFELLSYRSSDAFKAALPVNYKSSCVALLDLNLGSGWEEGLEVCEWLAATYPSVVIIAYSAYDDKNVMLKVLECGADDFISKNSEYHDLPLRITKAVDHARLRYPRRFPAQQFLDVGDRPIGLTMENVSQRIPKILNSALNSIFVSGETGTGKEVVIDLLQSYAEGPFVRVNCGAISPNLIESELFGHVKGSFTGATSDKKGFFEFADGGWIFLDELGSMSLPTQGALLRLLETGKFFRVGDPRERHLRVRVVSASNDNIPLLIQEGKFRQDLWQRIREAEILLPPLRERMTEFKALVQHFCQTMRGGPYIISDAAFVMLETYNWSDGNVRELRNCLRAMTEFSADRNLTPLAVPEWLKQKIKNRQPQPAEGIMISLQYRSDVTLAHLENELLTKVVEAIQSREGSLSLRALSDRLSVSRPALTARLRSVKKN